MSRLSESLIALAIRDIDKYAGPCKVDRLVSYSTLSTLWECVSGEIKRRRGIGPEDFEIQRVILVELEQVIEAIDEEMRKAQSRYLAAGRPWPFLDITQKGKIAWDGTWIGLLTEEGECREQA